MMCVLCGDVFIDGDETVMRGVEQVHRACWLDEQALEATWQDTGEA